LSRCWPLRPQWLLPQKKTDYDDVILRAMQDELERFARPARGGRWRRLVPTSSAIDLTDVSQFKVAAVLGFSHLGFARPLSARRRSTCASAATILTIQATSSADSFTGARYGHVVPTGRRLQRAARRPVLSTDAAYKTAVESMSRKRAALTPPPRRPKSFPIFSASSR